MITLISIILITFILLLFFIYKQELIFKVSRINNKNIKNKLKRLQNNKSRELNLKNKINYVNESQNLTNQEKAYFKKQMLELFKGSKKEKIKALNIAKHLSDKSTLHVLRMGLKDMDSDIVKISAELIEKFK